MSNLFKVPEVGEILPDDCITREPGESLFKFMSRSLYYRIEFTEKCGFVLWTKSSMDELATIIKNDKWLEVMSGTGYLGNTMNRNYHSNIIMTDDKSWKDGTLANSDIYKGIEQIDALDAIDKYHNDVKGVIMSWPPYDDPIAANVLNACYAYKLPIIYIGEFLDGCTADDVFFNSLIDSKYNCDDIIPSLRQFPGINDSAILITMH